MKDKSKLLLIAAIAFVPLLGIAFFAMGVGVAKFAPMLLLGMAVTANQIVKRRDGCRESIPVAASTTIYEGALVFVSATGYADDDTATGANRFAGIAVKQADNGSGSAGDIECEVYRDGVFLLSGSGFTQASVGLDAFATDNYTVTTAPSASGVKIGKVVDYVSSSTVYVAIEGSRGSANSTIQTKTADYTVTAGDSGRTFSTAGASGTVTFAMPAAVPGLRYRFYVGAAQELRIDPNGTETISLPSTGVAGAAGKYLTANAAGETVDIECVVAGTWSVFGYTGTWTAEA